MNWFDSSEALGLTGLKSLARTSPKKSFVVGGCSSASVVWVLRFWGLLGWCWLVGSSRTDSARPFWWVISQHSCRCWVSWSLGSPGKYPCSWQPGTVQASHSSAPQPRQGSALHKQKEWFCLFSWEFSVQRFKTGYWPQQWGDSGDIWIYGFLFSLSLLDNLCPCWFSRSVTGVSFC